MRMYDEQNKLAGDEAREADENAANVFREFMKKYPDANPREVGHVMIRSIMDVESENIIAFQSGEAT